MVDHDKHDTATSCDTGAGAGVADCPLHVNNEEDRSSDPICADKVASMALSSTNLSHEEQLDEYVETETVHLVDYDEHDTATSCDRGGSDVADCLLPVNTEERHGCPVQDTDGHCNTIDPDKAPEIHEEYQEPIVIKNTYRSKRKVQVEVDNPSPSQKQRKGIFDESIHGRCPFCDTKIKNQFIRHLRCCPHTKVLAKTEYEIMEAHASMRGFKVDGDNVFCAP